MYEIKKQVLTRQDVQEDLLSRLKMAKVTAIIMTVVIIIGVILYPIHLINYLNGTPYDYDGSYRSPSISATAAMFIMPTLIIFFIFFVLYVYYIDLYKIKKGKFEITEDTLWDKEKEWVSVYKHRSVEVNLLHFSYVSVPVEEDVYKYSRKGDRFYVVTLNPRSKHKRNTHLAYHTKYYEIKMD